MATVWRSPCAFARLFIRKTSRILNNTTDLGAQNGLGSQLVLAKNYSSYRTSPFVSKITEQYEYEIVKKPPEWKFVERLLPFDTIPKITPKESYPSGWIPPREEAENLPFFIQRNKNHEIPIYLNITFRGQRRITSIRKIDGDIWLMNDEVKEYLKNKHNRYVETRVHELGRFIEVKGDFVNDLRAWAHSLGF